MTESVWTTTDITVSSCFVSSLLETLSELRQTSQCPVLCPRCCWRLSEPRQTSQYPPVLCPHCWRWTVSLFHKGPWRVWAGTCLRCSLCACTSAGCQTLRPSTRCTKPTSVSALLSGKLGYVSKLCSLAKCTFKIHFLSIQKHNEKLGTTIRRQIRCKIIRCKLSLGMSDINYDLLNALNNK